MATHSQCSCQENSMNCMKRQKIWHWKVSFLAQKVSPYATGEDQRAITCSFRKNEAAGPKWKQGSFLGVSGGESKVWHCKEQYFLGTWNVRSMNQGELDVVKQEVARVFYNGILIFWRRKYQPTSVLLPGKFHGWRSLVGYSPWDCKESDTTELLHFLSFYSSFGRRKLQPTPVCFPGESHGQRGLVGCSLWGCKVLETTKQLTHILIFIWKQCDKCNLDYIIQR